MQQEQFQVQRQLFQEIPATTVLIIAMKVIIKVQSHQLIHHPNHHQIIHRPNHRIIQKGTTFFAGKSYEQAAQMTQQLQDLSTAAKYYDRAGELYAEGGRI